MKRFIDTAGVTSVLLTASKERLDVLFHDAGGARFLEAWKGVRI